MTDFCFKWVRLETKCENLGFGKISFQDILREKSLMITQDLPVEFPAAISTASYKTVTMLVLFEGSLRVWLSR